MLRQTISQTKVSQKRILISWEPICPPRVFLISQIIEFSLDLDTLMSVANTKSIVFKPLNRYLKCPAKRVKNTYSGLFLLSQGYRFC